MNIINKYIIPFIILIIAITVMIINKNKKKTPQYVLADYIKTSIIIYVFVTEMLKMSNRIQTVPFNSHKIDCSTIQQIMQYINDKDNGEVLFTNMFEKKHINQTELKRYYYKLKEYIDEEWYIVYDDNNDPYYFPTQNTVYELEPGVLKKPLGWSGSNDDYLIKNVFQFDKQFEEKTKKAFSYCLGHFMINKFKKKDFSYLELLENITYYIDNYREKFNIPITTNVLTELIKKLLSLENIPMDLKTFLESICDNSHRIIKQSDWGEMSDENKKQLYNNEIFWFTIIKHQFGINTIKKDMIEWLDMSELFNMTENAIFDTYPFVMKKLLYLSMPENTYISHMLLDGSNTNTNYDYLEDLDLKINDTKLEEIMYSLLQNTEIRDIIKKLLDDENNNEPLLEETSVYPLLNFLKEFTDTDNENKYIHKLLGKNDGILKTTTSIYNTDLPTIIDNYQTKLTQITKQIISKIKETKTQINGYEYNDGGKDKSLSELIDDINDIIPMDLNKNRPCYKEGSIEYYLTFYFEELEKHKLLFYIAKYKENIEKEQAEIRALATQIQQQDVNEEAVNRETVNEDIGEEPPQLVAQEPPQLVAQEPPQLVAQEPTEDEAEPQQSGGNNIPNEGEAEPQQSGDYDPRGTEGYERIEKIFKKIAKVSKDSIEQLDPKSSNYILKKLTSKINKDSKPLPFLIANINTGIIINFILVILYLVGNVMNETQSKSSKKIPSILLFLLLLYNLKKDTYVNNLINIPIFDTISFENILTSAIIMRTMCNIIIYYSPDYNITQETVNSAFKNIKTLEIKNGQNAKKTKGGTAGPKKTGFILTDIFYYLYHYNKNKNINENEHAKKITIASKMGLLNWISTIFDTIILIILIIVFYNYNKLPYRLLWENKDMNKEISFPIFNKDKYISGYTDAKVYIIDYIKEIWPFNLKSRTVPLKIPIILGFNDYLYNNKNSYIMYINLLFQIACFFAIQRLHEEFKERDYNLKGFIKDPKGTFTNMIVFYGVIYLLINRLNYCGILTYTVKLFLEIINPIKNMTFKLDCYDINLKSFTFWKSIVFSIIILYIIIRLILLLVFDNTADWKGVDFISEHIFGVENVSTHTTYYVSNVRNTITNLHTFNFIYIAIIIHIVLSLIIAGIISVNTDFTIEHIDQLTIEDIIENSPLNKLSKSQTIVSGGGKNNKKIYILLLILILIICCINIDNYSMITDVFKGGNNKIMGSEHMADFIYAICQNFSVQRNFIDNNVMILGLIVVTLLFVCIHHIVYIDQNTLNRLYNVGKYIGIIIILLIIILFIWSIYNNDFLLMEYLLGKKNYNVNALNEKLKLEDLKATSLIIYMVVVGIIVFIFCLYCIQYTESYFPFISCVYISIFISYCIIRILYDLYHHLFGPEKNISKSNPLTIEEDKKVKVLVVPVEQITENTERRISTTDAKKRKKVIEHNKKDIIIKLNNIITNYQIQNNSIINNIGILLNKWLEDTGFPEFETDKINLMNIIKKEQKFGINDSDKNEIKIAKLIEKHETYDGVWRLGSMEDMNTYKANKNDVKKIIIKTYLKNALVILLLKDDSIKARISMDIKQLSNNHIQLSNIDNSSFDINLKVLVYNDKIQLFYEEKESYYIKETIGQLELDIIKKTDNEIIKEFIPITKILITKKGGLDMITKHKLIEHEEEYRRIKNNKTKKCEASFLGSIIRYKILLSLAELDENWEGAEKLKKSVKLMEDKYNTIKMITSNKNNVLIQYRVVDGELDNNKKYVLDINISDKIGNVLIFKNMNTTNSIIHRHDEITPHKRPNTQTTTNPRTNILTRKSKNILHEHTADNQIIYKEDIPTEKKCKNISKKVPDDLYNIIKNIDDILLYTYDDIKKEHKLILNTNITDNVFNNLISELKTQDYTNFSTGKITFNYSINNKLIKNISIPIIGKQAIYYLESALSRTDKAYLQNINIYSNEFDTDRPNNRCTFTTTKRKSIQKGIVNNYDMTEEFCLNDI